MLHAHRSLSLISLAAIGTWRPAGTLSKGFALLVDGNAKIPGLVQRLVEKYTDTDAGIGPLALLKMMTTVEEVHPACFEDTIALIPPLLRDATTIDPDNNGARQFNAADLLEKLVDQFDPAQVLAAGDAVQELVDTIPHAIGTVTLPRAKACGRGPSPSPPFPIPHTSSWLPLPCPPPRLPSI